MFDWQFIRKGQGYMKISGILSALLIVLTLSACASGVSGSVSTATLGRAFPLAAGTPLPGNLAPISPSNAGQMTQLARWGEGTLQAIVSSPRAKLLAVATSLGVELLDSSTLDLLRFIPSNASITSLAFTPDGNTLAAGAADGSLFLFRVSDGKLLRTLLGHTGHCPRRGIHLRRADSPFGVCRSDCAFVERLEWGNAAVDKWVELRGLERSF